MLIWAGETRDNVFQKAGIARVVTRASLGSTEDTDPPRPRPRPCPRPSWCSCQICHLPSRGDGRVHAKLVQAYQYVSLPYSKQRYNQPAASAALHKYFSQHPTATTFVRPIPATAQTVARTAAICSPCAPASVASFAHLRHTHTWPWLASAPGMHRFGPPARNPDGQHRTVRQPPSSPRSTALPMASAHVQARVHMTTTRRHVQTSEEGSSQCPNVPDALPPRGAVIWDELLRDSVVGVPS